MKIHAEINTATHRFIVVEVASSTPGFKMLRMVKLPAGVEYKNVHQADAEILESWEVIRPRHPLGSNHAVTLEVMIQDLADYADTAKVA